MSEIDPLTRINELSGRLTDGEPLTDVELTELRTLLSAEIAAAETAEDTDDTLAHIVNVSNMAQAVAAEQATRDQAAAERATARDEALTRAREAVVIPEVEVIAEPVVEDVVAEQVPEPVAASARPKPIPLSRVHQTRRPEREPEGSDGPQAVALVASSGVRITDDEAGINELTARLNDAVEALGRRRISQGDKIVVATAAAPQQFNIGGKETPLAVRRLMDDAVKAQTSLTASGGLCRPGNIDYAVPTWSNIEEPAKGALPSIGAPRGSLTYGQAVAYDATVYGPGVAVWTAANDADPGGANTGPGGTGTGPVTKPCIEIDCSPFVTVDVEAITQCLQESNFRARFAPENVAMSMEYLQQAFVAKAEAERLRQMRAASKHVTIPQAFGATRDLFGFFDRVRAYFRSVYRLSDNVALEVYLESYVKEMIRIDLRKAAFATSSGSIDSLMVTDAQIEAYFASVGLSVTWILDDDIGDQTFAKATAGSLGAPSTFPWFPVVNHGSPGATTINVRALIFPSGTFQRLDGGELNIGVTRDTAMNAVNKFQIFSEIFEAVAMRGFESLDFQGSFLANGATAGTVTPA